jgi:hypothetical protein
MGRQIEMEDAAGANFHNGLVGSPMALTAIVVTENLVGM